MTLRSSNAWPPAIVAALEKTVEMSRRYSWFLAHLGYAYALTGKRVEALAVLRELEEKYAKGESRAIHLASVCASLGRRSKRLAGSKRISRSAASN